MLNLTQQDNSTKPFNEEAETIDYGRTVPWITAE
jgi:hypothetical protein